jgi:catalase-peroxidase
MAAAKDIRETFGRMAMNDEETVALIAGGHTFGKTHGAAGDPANGRAGAGGLPLSRSRAWAGRAAHSAAARAHTRSPAASRARGRNTPIQWDNGFFENLFKYEWELTTSPAGAKQWTAEEPRGADTVPDAHDPSKRHAPMMLTTDLSLRMDPATGRSREALLRESGPARRRVRQSVVQAASPRHGSGRRYLGPWVPEPQLWQDPFRRSITS